jgi:adenylosuccinate synthase
MKAVIGMNYGDEGKGHITNFLSGSRTLNVRFNGGAQAAHTVKLADGRTHVFHHFGSGSLKGARTLLSHHFIVNPILFAEEYFPMREVFVDPRARVTTPFDMLINSFASWYRKQNNTCGKGINETIERCKYNQLAIRMRDLLEGDVAKVLSIIENEYVPFRLKELKLPKKQYDEYSNKKITGRIIEQYLNVIKFMMMKVFVFHDSAIIDKCLEKGYDIVFEGAQGLLLDQGLDPLYGTRSNTGTKNIYSIMSQMKKEEELEVILVTRSYLTRHGDGPIIGEEYDGEPNYNPYQGKMRYAPFNEEWFNKALKQIPASVAVTCLDQVEIDIPAKYRSYGPTEDKIKM